MSIGHVFAEKCRGKVGRFAFFVDLNHHKLVGPKRIAVFGLALEKGQKVSLAFGDAGFDVRD